MKILNLTLCMPCPVRLSSISCLNSTTICYFTSDIMDNFMAGNDQQQTNQPNVQTLGRT